jgi:hypothetical protein
MFDVQRESSAASSATAISSWRQRERAIEDCMSGEAGRMDDEEACRREIRDRLRAQLRSEGERMRQAGRYCYEGEWLTRDEIAARIRARGRKAWADLLELIALLLAFCGAAFVLYKLAFLLA